MLAGAVVLAVIIPAEVAQAAPQARPSPAIAPIRVHRTAVPGAQFGPAAPSLPGHRAAAYRAARPVAAAVRKAVRPSPTLTADTDPAVSTREQLKAERQRIVRAASRRASAWQKVEQAHRASSAARTAASGMSDVVAYARAQVGKPYRFGATGPSSFDCSGLTLAAYARAGIHLPHSSTGQAARGRPVSRGNAQPGDLVVGPGHVGVYVGDGRMVDAPGTGRDVVERDLYPGLRLVRL